MSKDLDAMLNKAFGSITDMANKVKEDIDTMTEKVLEPIKQLKDLSPPRAPSRLANFPSISKIEVIHKPSEKILAKFQNLDLGYQKWALSLETQRHYYYTKFGKVHRKNSIEVKKDLKVKNQELDMVELMKKKKEGLYRDCMNELKEVLKKRKK